MEFYTANIWNAIDWPNFWAILFELKRLNLVINDGKIIDTNFIEVPKQKNSKAEKDQIKKVIHQNHLQKRK